MTIPQQAHSIMQGGTSNPSNRYATKPATELEIRENINQLLPFEVSSMSESETEDEGLSADDKKTNFKDHQENQTAIQTISTLGHHKNVDRYEEEDGEEDGDNDGKKYFRGRPSSCVFVASLAASLSDDELCVSVTEKFKTFGELARVKVLRDPKNRPYAFVQYTNDEDANVALRKAQGSLLNGRRLRCERANVNRTLFVTHSSAIDLETAAETLEEFGELEKLVPSINDHQYTKKLVEPIETNASWFVQFAYRIDAIRAFANLRSDPKWEVIWVKNIKVPKALNLLTRRNNQVRNTTPSKHAIVDEELSNLSLDCKPEGKRIMHCKPDMGGHEDNIKGTEGICESLENQEFVGATGKPGKEEFEDDNEDEDDEEEIIIDRQSIFVGQLHQSTTEKILQDRFGIYGTILDVNLINKPTNIFAFIKFETEEAAAAALERENHAILLNKTMHVQYKEIGGSRGRRKYSSRFNSYNYKSNPFVPNSVSRSWRKNIKAFAGPEISLAPPPINLSKKNMPFSNGSSGFPSSPNDTSSMVQPMGTSNFPMNMEQIDPNMMPFMTFPMPGIPPDFDLMMHMGPNPFLKSPNSPRRKSMFSNFGHTNSNSRMPGSNTNSLQGSRRSRSSKASELESKHQTDANTDINSESPGSADHTMEGSVTTYNHSSAGSLSGTHKEGKKDKDTSQSNNSIRGKYTRKYNYHGDPGAYYYPQFCYPSMPYPIGTANPMSHHAPAPPQPTNAGPVQPYWMVYPMPPGPSPTGLENGMVPAPMHIHRQRVDPSLTKHDRFSDGKKDCELDY